MSTRDSRSRRARILLVEVDPIARRASAQRLATQLPVSVVTAQHGFEALAWARSERFDVAILDSELPAIDATATRLADMLPGLCCVAWVSEGSAVAPSGAVRIAVPKAGGEGGLCRAIEIVLADVVDPSMKVSQIRQRRVTPMERAGSNDE